MKVLASLTRGRFFFLLLESSEEVKSYSLCVHLGPYTIVCVYLIIGQFTIIEFSDF